MKPKRFRFLRWSTRAEEKEAKLIEELKKRLADTQTPTK